MPRTRKQVIGGYVSGIFILSLNAGIFFSIGVHDWLRGEPSFWVSAVAVPVFLGGVIFFSRKIMSEIP